MNVPSVKKIYLLLNQVQEKYKFKGNSMKLIFSFLLFTSVLFSQISFDDYFMNKTLRLDYYHTGNNDTDFYSFDEMIEEPFWGGSRINLIDPFDYGSYKFFVYDDSTNTLIYSRSYSTLFQEWQTTNEALTTFRSFSETAVFPYPKKRVRIEFHGRDKKNKLEKRFEYTADPADYFIKKERRHEYASFPVLNSGDPSIRVDVVIIPEGYTIEEMGLFKEDCKKFANYLFNATPFKENKEKFNIWGVEAPSEESGTDIPADNIWKKTILNSTFYTFNLERYLMTSDNKSVRDVAANAPYDQIYILANSSKYGGGAIYNHYSVCVNKNMFEEYVFVHEFGHGFGFLADEYYTSDVAYNDYYPLDVEPLEKNLTTLVDFDSKWKHLIKEGVPVPTPNERKYENVVGVFEGGGYMNKGIYRPEYDCSMKSASVDNFCEVCKQALTEMIELYTK
jgi:hypothetical protein